ncbi:MAG: hypothetical protein O3C43_23540 [Verrucomicrobia bacterium]|nr:hypothetical protein [Verrucomicrobiota bacterium]
MLYYLRRTTLDSLSEPDLISYQVDEFELGLTDLSFYSYLHNMEEAFSIEDCWATWTVPFDHENGYFFLASCYYLSQPVVKFWEEKLNGRIQWFIVELGSLSTLLENAEQELKAQTTNA